MKILIVSTGIQNRSGTYVVLKNIIPFLMKNNEITILTNQGNVDIKYDKLIPNIFHFNNLNISC
jgi:hypothetical protein